MIPGRFKNRFLLTTAAVMLIPTAATAQNSGKPEAGAKEATDGDIIVTARKREESLQDVPISVQAFGANELSEKGIAGVTELAAAVPGLKLNMERAIDTEIFLRGIGSDIQGAGADTAIGMFLDGAYLSRSAGSLVDTYDLERVEVLKGPQSLRFGKSVIGGLINYVTKKPTRDFEGGVEASYGNYNLVNVAGSIRGPLSDTVSYGLSASSKSHDGYAKNTLGGDSESQNDQAVRAQLRFQPTNTLDINISGDYTRRRDGARWVNVVETGDSRQVTFLRFSGVPAPAPLTSSYVLPNRNAAFINADPRSGPRNFNGFQNADMWGLGGTIDWQASDRVHITSQTAYRKANLAVREEEAGMYFNFPVDPSTGIPIVDSAIVAGGMARYLSTVPDDWFDQRKSDRTRQFSQELRAAVNVSSSLDLDLGAYFLSEKIERSEQTNYLFADFQAVKKIAQLTAGISTFPRAFGGTLLSVTSSKNTNLGLFAAATYKVADTVSIEAGLRYAYDKKDFSVSNSGTTFAGVNITPYTVPDKRHWAALLPSATIRFKPNAQTMVYLGYARGYKAGGWTGEGADTPAKALVSFSPEYADSFEFGLKTDLADRRIRINSALFYTKYRDLQLNEFLTPPGGIVPSTYVVNAAGGTRAYGLELEANVRIVSGVTLNGNYTYTNCKFIGDLIVDANGTNNKGNNCRRTPRNAFTVGMAFNQPVNGNVNVFGGVDYSYTSSYNFDNENTADLRVDSQINLSARIGVRSNDKNKELFFWARNLTNELNNYSVFTLFSTKYETYAAPRTFGATFKARF